MNIDDIAKAAALDIASNYDMNDYHTNAIRGTIARHLQPLAEELKAGCRCSCHTMPGHSTLQDFADANKYHVGELTKIREQRDRLLEEFKAIWQECQPNCDCPICDIRRKLIAIRL